MAALVVLMAVAAPAAQARGRLLGLVPRLVPALVGGAPAPLRPAATAAAAADGTGSLSYGGGPVMHAHQTYVIFWDPGHAFSDDFKARVAGYLTDVGRDSATRANVYSVATEYGDASGSVGYQSSFGGAYTDPTRLSAPELRPEPARPDLLAVPDRRGDPGRGGGGPGGRRLEPGARPRLLPAHPVGRRRLPGRDRRPVHDQRLLRLPLPARPGRLPGLSRHPAGGLRLHPGRHRRRLHGTGPAERERRRPDGQPHQPRAHRDADRPAGRSAGLDRRDRSERDRRQVPPDLRRPDRADGRRLQPDDRRPSVPAPVRVLERGAGVPRA